MRAEIGHIAPPFALNDHKGENATPLEDKVMGDPVLLVFDRNPVDSDPENSAELLRTFAGLVAGLEGRTVTLLLISRRSKEENARLADAEDIPFHLLTDSDGAVFDDYGIALAADTAAPPASLIIDPNGRVAEICEGIETAAQIDRLLTCLIAMHADKPHGRLGMHPPVLVIPNVLDGETCARLIETFDRPVPLWESDGRVSEGLNVEQGDFKVRNEAYGNVVQYIVRDAELMRELDTKVMRRVIPQMDKAFGL
jgi:peroxiredoxin